jgi:hypothetical protein
MDANIVRVVMWGGDLNANQSMIATNAVGNDGKGVDEEEGTTIATSLLLGDFNRGSLLRSNGTAKDSASSSDGDHWLATACMFVHRRTMGQTNRRRRRGAFFKFCPKMCGCWVPNFVRIC